MISPRLPVIPVYGMKTACVGFLADRTDDRAYATMLCPSVCLSVCNVCIVVKQCVLDQKLLLTADRKSYMRNRFVLK